MLSRSSDSLMPSAIQGSVVTKADVSSALSSRWALPDSSAQASRYGGVGVGVGVGEGVAVGVAVGAGVGVAVAVSVAVGVGVGVAVGLGVGVGVAVGVDVGVGTGVAVGAGAGVGVAWAQAASARSARATRAVVRKEGRCSGSGGWRECSSTQRSPCCAAGASSMRAVCGVWTRSPCGRRAACRGPPRAAQGCR